MNILVMGVPRSGTSILAAMINKLGWNFSPDANWGGESRYIEKLNKDIVAGKHPTIYRKGMSLEADIFFKSLVSPWLIKSPSFCYTLPLVSDVLDKKFAYGDNLLLIAIRKPQDKLEESWRRLLGTKVKEVDGELIDAGGRSLSEWSRMLDKSYAEHTGPKIMLDYDKLTAAVKLFDLGRAGR